MVIVITDGESNVKKDQTVPKAEQMHEEGIEVNQQLHILYHELYLHTSSCETENIIFVYVWLLSSEL